MCGPYTVDTRVNVFAFDRCRFENIPGSIDVKQGGEAAAYDHLDAVQGTGHGHTVHTLEARKQRRLFSHAVTVGSVCLVHKRM